MDDKNAFVRQIAAEIDYEVGPPHPVDALAITRAAKTPTAKWRIQSMFSPVQAITAGAIVFALGGVFLVAQPFDQQGSAPGAATDEPATAPSFFSGTTDNWVDNAAPVPERRDDGVETSTGQRMFDWVANDPRIAGRATMVVTETDYRNGATVLESTGEIGTIGPVLLRIDNEGGSWEGPLTWLGLEDPESVSISGWLTGTDAYEGLSAFVAWSFGTAGPGRDIAGHITAEGPPPVPELPEE